MPPAIASEVVAPQAGTQVFAKGRSAVQSERLIKLVDAFQADVEQYLIPLAADGKASQIVLASAWLVSDNVIVDLLHRHFPSLARSVSIAAVDTLHLFQETHEVAGEMRGRYGIRPYIAKPEGCETKEAFDKKFGAAKDLKDHDFDGFSKIKPLQSIFALVEKDVVVTGRRADQGSARVKLDVWESNKRTFNPLANWDWKDIVDYATQLEVPFNRKHHTIYRSSSFVPAIERYAHTAWQRVELERPYWTYSLEELQGGEPYVYVWKSFGDVHTSVPVGPHESERAGRFVGRVQTECGIHTRIALTKSPHGGGELVDRLVSPEAAAELREKAGGNIVEVGERAACDIELIGNGGFSPLQGFMTQTEYNGVVHDMRLPEGQLMGLPVTLAVVEEVAVGNYVLLKSPTYGELAVLEVKSCWRPDKDEEAKNVYGTTSITHPSVFHLKKERGEFYIGGPLHVFKLPERDWVKCRTPRQIRAEVSKEDETPLVAFQCRNPIHRAHLELFRSVQKLIPGARVMVHPVVGPTKSDDFAADVRVKTYEALQEELVGSGIHFEYLPYNMMVGGPRECLQHMIVRKNYGCTHMIVGRDHAGCKDTETGVDFYAPYDAQELVFKLQGELNMKAVKFMAQVYVPELERYMALPEAQEKGYETANISGTKFRKLIREDQPVPEWYAFPSVVAILKEAYAGK